MSAPHPFWVYDDPARGLVLIRGDVRDLLDEAGVSERARWSTTGKGYVLAAGDLADVLATADYRNRRYRIKQVAA